MASNADKPSKVELLRRLQEGSIPDEELRRMFRLGFQKRLQRCQKTSYEEQTTDIVNLAKSLRRMSITTDSDNLNSEMYEVPISFLKILFGKLLKGSACYFKDYSTTLDEAEIAILDLYCERAQLKEGQKVLDLGCGQGAVTLHIAQKYKGSHVTAVTNSVSQKAFIEEQCKSLKLSNVEVLLEDIAKLKLATKFDRIMTIGLLEHMKNYAQLFERISEWMSEDGLLLVDHVCHKTFAYPFEPIDEEDGFMDYVFPPGSFIMTSASFLLYFQENVSIVDHWTVSGKHFSRTNDEWLKKLDANMPAAKEILEVTYGSKEAAHREFTYWRTLALFSTELFSYNNGEEWMNCHLLFKKK